MSPTFAPQPTFTPAPTSPPPPTPAPIVGERGNPIPLNYVATYPTWEVSVVSFDEDATSAIAEENQFNDPPASGHVYVLIQLQGTYTGTGFGSMWLDLDYYLVGDTNVVYEQAWIVTADELSNQSDALPGGTVVGNLAFMVPEETVDSLVMLITDGGLRYADTIAYFSLGNSTDSVSQTAAPQPTTAPASRATPSPTSVPRPTSSPAPTSPPLPTPAPIVGERGNPIPLNYVATYPTWEVSVVSFDEDATSAIAEENQFNDPPASGHVYVLIQLQGTYTGTGFGSMWLDLDYYLVGDTNVVYEQAWIVTADELSNQSDALPGGTVVGNLAFMVPEETVDSLVMLITDGGLRYADTIAYFSLGNPTDSVSQTAAPQPTTAPASRATPSPTSVPRPTSSPAPTSPPLPTPAPIVGERGNPIPLNYVATYPTWEVSVVSFDEDATSAIAEENQFNDPPASGHVYVLIQLQGTYTGTGFGSMWLDLDYYLVGDTNVVYEQAWIVTADELSNPI